MSSLVALHKFWYLVLLCVSSQSIFSLPFAFLLWPICYLGHLAMCCLISIYLRIFQVYFVFNFSTQLIVVKENTLYDFNPFKFILAFWHIYGLSWRMCYMYLRRMRTSLLLDGVLYICLLNLVGSYFCSHLLFPIGLLSGCYIHYGKWGIEFYNYYCWIVYFPFHFVSFGFMCSEASVIDSYMFIML